MIASGTARHRPISNCRALITPTLFGSSKDAGVQSLHLLTLENAGLTVMLCRSARLQVTLASVVYDPACVVQHSTALTVARIAWAYSRFRAPFARTQLWHAAGCYSQASGSSANDDDGTEAKPFASIQNGIDVAVAGDTVVMRGGTYRQGVRFRNSGAAGLLSSWDYNAVAFEGGPSGDKPLQSTSLFLWAPCLVELYVTNAFSLLK